MSCCRVAGLETTYTMGQAALPEDMHQRISISKDLLLPRPLGLRSHMKQDFADSSADSPVRRAL